MILATVVLLLIGLFVLAPMLVGLPDAIVDAAHVKHPGSTRYYTYIGGYYMASTVGFYGLGFGLSGLWQLMRKGVPHGDSGAAG